jgi:hypothetical protein
MNTAVNVFAKVPAPGLVKTRLTPPLDIDEAADLYAAFLQDALAQYATLEADIRLYLAPSGFDLMKYDIPDCVSLHEQIGEDLGARMARAFVETFAAGYERVVILGTDHPTLPSAFIEVAFDALSSGRSVVIGPADDGGYYLLGMNDFIPELFRKMEYSHEEVFQQTLDRIPSKGVDVTILPVWYDIDRPDDVLRLVSELTSGSASIRHTRRVLMHLTERHPWLQGD